MNINDSTEFTIRLGVRSGNPVTRVVKLGDFPENAVLKMLAYGIQRTFNDPLGGSDTDLATKEAELDEMLAEYKAGNIGRKPRQAVDPVTHEAFKLIRSMLSKEQRQRLKDREDADEVLAQLLEQNPDVRKQAEKIVSAQAKKPAIKLDGINL